MNIKIKPKGVDKPGIVIGWQKGSTKRIKRAACPLPAVASISCLIDISFPSSNK
jgi:hypothetical protein